MSIRAHYKDGVLLTEEPSAAHPGHTRYKLGSCAWDSGDASDGVHAWSQFYRDINAAYQARWRDDG